jgi:hypothetical protein
MKSFREQTNVKREPEVSGVIQLLRVRSIFQDLGCSALSIAKPARGLIEKVDHMLVMLGHTEGNNQHE